MRSAHGPDDLYPRWQRHSPEQWRALDESLFLQTGVPWFTHRDAGRRSSGEPPLACHEPEAGSSGPAAASWR